MKRCTIIFLIFMVVTVLFAEKVNDRIEKNVYNWESGTTEFVDNPARDSRAVPNLIDYQGKITDSSSNPITSIVSITFTIYDDATGGSNLWDEIHSSVTPVDGLVHVLLGSVDAFGTSLFDGSDLWLGINVNSDGEMTPRLRIVSVPYAIYANDSDNLDGYDSDDFVNSQGDTMTGNLVVNADFQATGITRDSGGDAGTSGQVLSSTGTATDWVEAASFDGHSLDAAYDEGRIITADAGAFEVGGVDGALFTGTNDSGTIPVEGAGTRMMWYPAKAAFRAGYVDGTQWDETYIGFNSTALGNNTIARGSYSLAIGDESSTGVSGSWALSMGRWCESNSVGSVAIGYMSVADGAFTVALGYQDTVTSAAAYSVAIGYRNKATSVYSLAMGSNTTASMLYASAFGNTTIASGQNSFAAGYLSQASGNAATTFGTHNTASGYNSMALGYETEAQAYGSLVIGRYNVIEGSSTYWQGAEPLFVAGNGVHSGSLNNALTLYQNGNMTIAGSLTELSDKRLKENIVKMENVLQNVLDINPVYFEFKDKKSHPSGRQIGFIAQEIEPLFPELIAKDSEGYLSLEYSNMTAVLLQAIKEQQQQIEELKQQIAELK